MVRLRSSRVIACGDYGKLFIQLNPVNRRIWFKMIFRLTTITLVVLTLLWWQAMARRIRCLRHPRFWLLLWTGFIAAMVLTPPIAFHLGYFLPPVITSTGFLWQVMVLPATLLLAGLDAAYVIIRRRFVADAPPDADRRRFLVGVAAAGPVFLTGGLTTASMWQLGRFRVRDLDLPVTGFPAALNGFTIALVADIHNGPFCTPQMLADIVEQTNSIHNGGPADLVVLGGDLINTTLHDLPPALEMAKALRSRLGTVAIFGNHDGMDSRATFIREMDKSGIPLLIDDCLIIEPLPGTKLQLVGIDWQFTDPDLFASVAAADAKRDRSLFPICLAHHPHAWDEAVRRGLPLTLAGHTHGGQIMLTDSIGGGPLKFRYWKGEHERNGCKLAITNGVGNWFPLRINAPAEILKITLRA